MLRQAIVAILLVGCLGLDCESTSSPQSKAKAPLISGTGIAGYKALFENGYMLPYTLNYNDIHSAGICLFTSGDFIHTTDVSFYHGPHDPYARAYGRFETRGTDSLLFSGPVTGMALFSRDSVRISASAAAGSRHPADGSYLYLRDSAYAWNLCGIINR